jgi:hypothetical protein
MSPPHADSSASASGPTATKTEADTALLADQSPTVTLNRKGQTPWPRPPSFDDKHKERQYLKERLALAFRIFGKFGYDEGVAGHITLRVRTISSLLSFSTEENTPAVLSLKDQIKILI